MTHLTYERAREIVTALKTLPFCPDADGLGVVATDLVAWCQGFAGWAPEQQAGWLIQQVRNDWDKWHGSKLMKEIFDREFTVLPASDSLTCEACKDFGWILPANFGGPSNGVLAEILFTRGEPCTCAAGLVFAEQKAEWHLAYLSWARASHADEVAAHA